MREKEVLPTKGRYVSLYRRYRPQRFGEVIGQDAAVAVLRRSLEDGKTGHAYLFSGPRGCGKTSLARILSKALNCTDPQEGAEPCGKCTSCLAITAGESLDVIEIDGASNRGIDEVRELKAHVSLAPFGARRKIYIVDEVHMLTEPAFNALLKTLEEPPSHVVFVLATTEPQKVPVTIRSRCQHIPFRRIPGKDIALRLEDVCKKEQVPTEQAAIWELARQADGAMRDALSLLEQAIPVGSGSVTVEAVRALVGGGSRAEMEIFVTSFRASPEIAVRELMESLQRGASMERLVESLFLIFRDLWILKSWGEKALDGLELSQEEKEFLVAESSFWSPEALRSSLDSLSRLLGRLRMGIRTDVLAGFLLKGLSAGQPAAVKEIHEAVKAVQPLPAVFTKPAAVLAEKPGEASKQVPRSNRGKEESSLPVADPEKVRSFWETLVRSEDQADRQLTAVLSGASVRIAEEGIIVDFDVRDRVAYELLRLERNLRKFTACKEGLLGSLPVTFCCGEECIRAEGAAIPETLPKENSKAAPWEKVKKRGETAAGSKDVPQKPVEEPLSEVGSGSSAIKEMIGWFGGEVLLVREDDAEIEPAVFEEGSIAE